MPQTHLVPNEPSKPDSVNAGAKAASDQPRELAILLATLEEAIADVESAVELLALRIGPLRMAVPTNNCSADQIHESASSPLGGNVVTKINRLRGIANQMHSMIDEMAI
jgi:hypothetical protein